MITVVLMREEEVRERYCMDESRDWRGEEMLCCAGSFEEEEVATGQGGL